MSNVALAKMIEHWNGSHDPDAHLLTRFLADRDEDAFAALVHRHGPLVYGTCLRILGNGAEADDAFQATFFVLARRANTLNLDRSIGPWLHGVALRVAKKLRSQTVRRRLREMSAAKSERVDTVESQADFWAILDEELARLTLQHRELLLLCDLGGQSHSQAAESLGLAKGTVTTRLGKAREELASRLRRRGITLSVGALTLMIATQATASILSLLLVEAAKQATAINGSSLAVHTLAEAVMRSLKVGVLKVWLFVGLIAMTLTGGGLMLAGGPGGSDEKKAEQPKAAVKPEQPKVGTMWKENYTIEYPGTLPVSVAFSADGKTLLTGDTAGEVMALTLREDSAEYRWKSKVEGKHAAVAYSADGKQVYATTEHGVRVLAEKDGKEEARIEAKDSSPTVIGVFPNKIIVEKKLVNADGTPGVERITRRQFVIGNSGGYSVKLWNVKSWIATDLIDTMGTLTTRTRSNDKPVPDEAAVPLAIDPKGRSAIMTGPIDGKTNKNVLWAYVCGNYDEGSPGNRLMEGHTASVVSAAWSKEGSTAVTGDADGRVIVWDAKTMKESRRVEFGGCIGALAMSDDGTRTAAFVLRKQGEVYVWDTANPAKAMKPIHTDDADFTGTASYASLSFSPDGKRLAGCASNKLLQAIMVRLVGKVHVWEFSNEPKSQHQPKVVIPKVATSEQPKQPDDPLPAGSVLRFGTARFRHGVPILTMAVSADGKTAYVASGSRSDGSTRAIDLDTGRSIFNIPGDGEGVAISPDGKTIVIKANLVLRVCDAKTGKELRTLKISSTSDRRSDLDVLAFTPDGKALATITDSKDLHLIDFESGQTIRVFPHDPSASENGFSQVNAVAFSPDGKRVATGGYTKVGDDYFARLWDVETGQEIRRFSHGQAGYGIRCLMFSPDGKTLATLGTQAGVLLRLFDVDSGKLLRTFPKADRLRPESNSIAFSPDGKTVAVGLNSIHLYDVATGEERLRIDRRACNLFFTDGGKTLTGAVSGAIYRWDTTTGKTLTPEAGDSVVAQILVTPDGSRVFTRDHYGYGHIWEGTTGQHLRKIPVAWQRNIAMSPDGRYLAWPVNDSSVTFTVPQQPRSIYDGSRIRLYDIAADKVIDRFPAYKGDAQDLAFNSDGKKLVSIDHHASMVRTWDFESGKEERSFAIQTEELKKKSFFVQRTQLSPDGKTAVVTHQENLSGMERGIGIPPQLVRLWDITSGKQLPENSSIYAGDRAFSPGGRLVFASREVHEIATGRRVAALPEEPYIRAAAFSRDGRFLATAVQQGVVQIWEVATWTKRNEFKGYEDRSITLTFGPGGRLFTGNHDTTTLAWNTRPARVADLVTLETAWNNLATRESSVSFKTEGRFLATPAETVKLFAEKIKPAAALDAKQVQQLLADLGSEEFAVREASSKALLGLNQQAIPHLEATLKTTESAEVRSRLEKLLDQHRRVAMTTEQLRESRAVMVLELIGDPDSKNLLKTWASGPAGALLTMDASAALKRLEGLSKK